MSEIGGELWSRGNKEWPKEDGVSDSLASGLKSWVRHCGP